MHYCYRHNQRIRVGACDTDTVITYRGSNTCTVGAMTVKVGNNT